MPEDSYVHVAGLLSSLGRALGLSELALDEDGACTLMFDERISIHLIWDEDTRRLVLHCRLGSLGDRPDRAQWCEQLLAANLFWSGTGGGTLAIEPSRGDVFLLHSLEPSVLDESSFQDALESFVETAISWMEDLSTPVSVGEKLPVDRV